MTLRLVLFGLFAAALATEASAQTITDDPADLFRSELDWLEHRLSAPADTVRIDTEYEGLEPAEPTARAPSGAAGPWVVDVAGIAPPFGLDRVDDPALRAFFDFYAGEGLRRATGWLARSGRYRALLEAELDAMGAPRELLWVVAIESAFEPDALSRAGAAGLWQLMPRTARALGLRVDSEVDERLDPVRSTRVAVTYLLEQHTRFRSWPIALAAYNAGQGHARSEVRRYAVTDFWEMDAYGALYDQARRYALRAITMAVIDQVPERFGADGVVRDEPVVWDEVEVDGGVRLTLFAEAAGCELDELRALNPHLVALRTPRDAERWTVRIPAGSYDRFVERYDRLARYHGADHREVTLRFGETVEDVAGRFGMSARLLRALNGLEPLDPSPYGATLMVPTRFDEQASAPPGDTPTVIVPATRFAFADRERVFYAVNRQDRLAEIAAHFGVDVFHLAAWNDLDPDAALPEDLVLQVWVSPDRALSDTIVRREAEVTALALGSPEWAEWEEARESETRSRRRTYTIQRGDTLLGIADRFGVRVSDLMRWNGLDDAGQIYAGQELRVSR